MKRFLIALILGYQRFFAKDGFFSYKQTTCLFYPSCSEYARQAITEHGPLHGTLLSLGRLARCRPFAEMNIDEVTPRIK